MSSMLFRFVGVDGQSQVEDTRYRVHRYFFEQHSEDFIVKYNLSADFGPENTAYIQLDDVKTCDFDQLLSIFYPR